jgi:hypothetical protein
MKKNNNSSPDDFDSFFKDKLGDGHMEPSAGLWDKIESQLEEKKKPSLLFPGLGVLILLALGISVGVYFFGSKPKDPKRDNIIAQSEKRTNSNQESVMPENTDKLVSEQTALSQETSQTSERSESKNNSEISTETKLSKPESKINETQVYTSNAVNNSTDPGKTTANQTKEEPALAANQNAGQGISPTKIPVKTEPENSTGKQEKSNGAAKALPVLGSGTAKVKVSEEQKNSNQKNSEPIVAEQKKQENIPVQTETKDQETAKKEETATPVTNTENTGGESVKEETKTSDPAAVVHQPDSLPIDDYGKIALSVGIGVNQILPATVSTLGSTEKYLTSFGDEFKFQYRPCKFISANIGVGYSFYKMQRDATDFSFNRHSSGDYTFNTTIGVINMDYNTLLLGYEATKKEVLNAKYSYYSQIDFINLPIEFQAHILNKKKFRLWSGFGVNGSYVLSQNTRFNIEKEKVTQTYNYSEVFLKSRINAYATLSLGVDIKFRDKMFIYLSPSYRYGLTNMSQGTGLVFKPQAFTGIVGVKFILR